MTKGELARPRPPMRSRARLRAAALSLLALVTVGDLLFLTSNQQGATDRPAGTRPDQSAWQSEMQIASAGTPPRSLTYRELSVISEHACLMRSAISEHSAPRLRITGTSAELASVAKARAYVRMFRMLCAGKEIAALGATSVREAPRRTAVGLTRETGHDQG